MNKQRILAVTLFILVIGHGSDASFLDKIRKLGGHGPKQKLEEISPSPAPGSTVNGGQVNKSGDVETPDISPTLPPTDGTTNKRCSMSSKPCHDHKNLTACLVSPPTASKELSLLVQNDGEIPLKVNVTISHVENIFEEIQIPKHQAKKINISANVGGSPSIVLNAGNGECVIYLRSDGNIFKQLPSFATQVTPIYGAYLLFSIALISGGAWACCKLGRSERQGDGIPYQELEMGRPESLSANGAETAEGWDEGWDDDWDEIKEVNSPDGRQRGNVSANGFSSRSSDRNEWGNDWDE